MGKRKNRGKSLTISRPTTQKYIAENANSIVINKLEVRPIVRQSQDIQRWRSAHLMAEGIGQQRALLYDIYSDVLLDGYLSEGLMGKRRMSITNKTLVFTNQDGTKNDAIVTLTEKTPFEDLLKHIIDARFWGHSLIELNWIKDDTTDNETILIPRKHVKPRSKIVVKSEWDSEGHAYNEPPFSETVIAVGGEEDLGILNMVTPLALWKRANMGDWAEFIETFGMPTVFAKYNNEQSRKVLIDALDKMGSRGRAVMPNDASMEYHDTSGSSRGDVFNDFRASLNEEMSITVLGNTMTTSEAKNSGYAQSKTHEKSQAEVHKDDCRFVLRILSEKLTPFLVRIGYTECAGGKWQFVDEETMSLAERLEIDLKVAEKVPISEDYWYEKYKIPRPTDAEKKKPKPPVRLQLSHAYNANHCPICGTNEILTLSDDNTEFIDLEANTAYLKRLFNHQIGGATIDSMMWESLYDSLRSGLFLGMRETLHLSANQGFEIQTNYGEDWRFNYELTTNTGVFAAFKNHSANQDLINQLVKPDGTLKSFREFQKDTAGIVGNYHKNWLQAEYQTCIASARMAQKWRNFERRADVYPNLRYMTQHDSLVRPEHAILDGITQPVKSAFWLHHYPPNGYRCRCNAIQTDAKATDSDTKGWYPKPPFDNNVGLSAKPFSDNHPIVAQTDAQDKPKIVAQANRLLAEKSKLEVRIWAKDHLVDKPIALPTPKPIENQPIVNPKIVLTKESVKRVTDQPHSNPHLRNSLLFILKDIVKEFVLTIAKAGFYCYLWKSAFGEKLYFNFKEKNNDFELDSITDEPYGDDTK